MPIRNRLSRIFPAWEEIPSPFRITTPVKQREYLIDGELRRLEGATQEVFSPVCVDSAAGLKRHRIGSFPLMTEAEALAVLDAAVAAYDNGRGWSIRFSEWGGR